MRIPPSLLLAVGRFLLFILLEAACIYMVCNNGLVQRYRLIGELREIQGFFWERVAAINEYSSLKKANGILAAQNTLLMQELYKQKEITGHIAADTLCAPFSFIQAKVIRNTLNTPHNYLIIDKGSKDGVEEDMGVITPNGVVGITRGVSENYSYALSFKNHMMSISARLRQDGPVGTMAWDGKSRNTALLKEIPHHIQHTPGDTVYTSGYSAIFPAGIPVGTTENARIVNGSTYEMDVNLFEDFNSLRYAIIVGNIGKDEINTLEQKMQ